MNNNVWNQDLPKQLATTLASTASISDMQNLLRDLMTEKEIFEISARLEAARMLKEGAKYTDIIQSTKLSSRTVARISEWLKNGENGYEKAIETINAQQLHTRPAPD